jgi:hypothetical protein
MNVFNLRKSLGGSLQSCGVAYLIQYCLFECIKQFSFRIWLIKLVNIQLGMCLISGDLLDSTLRVFNRRQRLIRAMALHLFSPNCIFERITTISVRIRFINFQNVLLSLCLISGDV